jgi:hypothetical protein
VNEEFLAAEKAITEYTAAYPDAINAAMNTLDGSSLIKFLNKFNKALTKLNNIVAGITKENGATQMGQFVVSGKALNDIVTKHAPAIKSTGSVSRLSALRLVQPAMTLVRNINSDILSSCREATNHPITR